MTTSASKSLAASGHVDLRRRPSGLPKIAACIFGACADRQAFHDTAQAILRQDYGGDIVLLVPQGAEVSRDWARTGKADGRRLIISPAVDMSVELDCNTAFAIALTLRPPVDFFAILHCGARAPRRWLESLRTAQEQFDADLVIGSVKAVYDQDPADWVLAGSFFDRLGFQRGPIPRPLAADNSLIRSEVVRSMLPHVFADPAPNPHDWIDFSYRARALGFTSVWANDAIIFDTVPKSWMDERWIVDSEYSKAYAMARAQCCYRPGEAGEALLRIRALGLLAAGLASSGVFRLNQLRRLKGRLMQARARGTIAGCAAHRARDKEAA